jgi:hypothetical protein
MAPDSDDESTDRRRLAGLEHQTTLQRPFRSGGNPAGTVPPGGEGAEPLHGRKDGAQARDRACGRARRG